MPAITATAIKGSAVATVARTTLNGTDSFVYNGNKRPVLLLKNPTGGAISPVIDGADADAAYAVPGVGEQDLTGGYAVGAIAAGAEARINLEDISAYLQGTIAINSGSGLEAALLEH